MPLESYSRVELLLPANDRIERDAVDVAIDLVRVSFGGVTVSALDEPVFNGYYHGSTGWMLDKVVQVFADTTMSHPDLEDALRSLHERLIRSYVDVCSPQEEFWITITPMQRYQP